MEILSNEAIFALISVAFQIASATPYVRWILRGEVIPHPFSFGTWFFLVGTNAIVLWQNGGEWNFAVAVLQTLTMLAYTVVGLFAFRRISINWFDYACLGMSALTFASLLFVSKESTVAMAIVVDLIAFLPSVKKAFLQPKTENSAAWFIAAVFPVFILLSSRDYSFSNVAFYSYMVISNGGFAVLVWYWQRRGN